MSICLCGWSDGFSIKVFTSLDDQFWTNSVILEGTHEVMLVDAQLIKTNAERRLPGLHVEYSAVLKKANSSEVITVDGGSIYVETEAAYQRRLAKEKEQEKSRTKM